MSMFSSDAGNFDVSLEDVSFILGPSMRVISKDDSFLQESEQELVEPYDENNAFNVFSNNLKLRKKTKTPVDPIESVKESKPGDSGKESVGLSKEQKDAVRGLTINIKRLHLRYEDDYYSGETPYSFGVVIDELRLDSSNMRLFFDRLADMQLRQASLQSDDANQLVKDLNVRGLRLYWNCLSEMYIPTSLWESTRSMKYGIFEAMEAQQLNEMMNQVFTTDGQIQFQFIVSDIDIQTQLHCHDQQERQLDAGQTRSITSFSVQISPLRVLMNTHILADIIHFIERMQSQFLIRDLKQYRPHRRPITEVPKHLISNSTLRRKRRLIARDWFFFVVWFVRLRRIIRTLYQRDGKAAFFLLDPKFQHILQQALTKEISLDTVIQKIKAATDSQRQQWPFKNEINVRVGALELNLFTQQLFDINPQVDCPSVMLSSKALAFNATLSGVPSRDRIQDESLNLQVKLNSLEVHTFSKQAGFSTARPRQLNPMMLKKEVCVQQIPIQLTSQTTIRGPATPHKPMLSSMANAANRAANQQLSNNNNQMRTKGLQQIRQPQMVRSEYGSIQLKTLTDPMTICPDTERMSGPNIPNVTSPGRLMIGPKVSTNEVMLGPQQRQQQARNIRFIGATAYEKQRQQPNEPVLKKSASKDSLMSNMLTSMTGFLASAIRGNAEPSRQPGLAETPGSEDILFESNQSLVQGDNSVTNWNNLQDDAKYKSIDVSTIQVDPSRFQHGQRTTKNMNATSYQHQQQQQPHPATTFIKNSQASRGLQATNKRESQSRVRGLEHLLKGSGHRVRSGIRSTATRSFHGGQLNQATEGNPADMSMLMGSHVSAQNDNDEDIVMDSGGRKINQHNNWIDPNYSLNNTTQHSNFKVIEETVRNKNLITTSDNSRPYSDQNHQTPDFSLNHGHQLTKRQTAPGSTLGRLLQTQQSNVKSGSQIMLSQGSVTNTNREQTQQSAFSMRTTNMPVTSTAISDETCNVLPSQVAQRRPNQEGQVIKETLVKFGQADQAQHAVHASYKLSHESRLARQVDGELNFGKVEVTYSNNALSTISELLIGFKSQASFRDFTLIPDCMLPKGGYSQEKTVDQASDERAEKKEQAKILAVLADFQIDSQTRQSHPKKEAAINKAKVVTKFFQKCAIDMKVSGDRLYVSCFDEKSRDQVAKFVSPPVSMSLIMHPPESPVECSYEVFGFKIQQSTDLNLLANFASAMHNQVQMFSQNESIRRGKVYYDEIIATARRKQDEKRHLTQRILSRKSRANDDAFTSGFMSIPQEESKQRPRAKQQTVKTSSKSNISQGPPKQSSKPFARMNQVMKPGAQVQKLPDTDGEDVGDGGQYKVGNTMISRGLLLQDVPSKGMLGAGSDSDIEEVPLPDDDDDDESLEDRDKFTHFNKKIPSDIEGNKINATRALLDETPLEQQQSRNKKTQLGEIEADTVSHHFESLLNNSAYNLRPPMDLRDMHSPRSNSDPNAQVVPPQRSTQGSNNVISNNSNLREASALNLNQAYINVGADVNMAYQLNNELGYAKRSHTDSAGGEARDNSDYDFFNKQSARQNYAIEQDAPQLPGPTDNKKEQQPQAQEAHDTSGGSDGQMGVFDDPSIQNGPRQTQKKHNLILRAGHGTAPSKQPLNSLPPTPKTRQDEESKKWKSTREAQTYQLKKAKSSSKLLAARDNSNGGAQARQASCSSTNSRKKVTPNHMLNFSKQLNTTSVINSKESPLSLLQPHSVINNNRSILAIAAAASNNGERNEPQSTMTGSPSKKHIKQVGSEYTSQKQLMEAMRSTPSQLKQAISVTQLAAEQQKKKQQLE